MKKKNIFSFVCMFSVSQDVYTTIKPPILLAFWQQKYYGDDLHNNAFLDRNSLKKKNEKQNISLDHLGCFCKQNLEYLKKIKSNKSTVDNNIVSSLHRCQFERSTTYLYDTFNYCHLTLRGWSIKDLAYSIPLR